MAFFTDLINDATRKGRAERTAKAKKPKAKRPAAKKEAAKKPAKRSKPKTVKEAARRSRLSEKDQLGLGSARRATRQVRQQTKNSRLDSIMAQIRKAQSTDSHQ